MESVKTHEEEFIKFHKALMGNAPEGYVPWYFPVTVENKNPDGIAVMLKAPANLKEGRCSWKAPHARLTYEEALERLKGGCNVGIAARTEDPLIIIDIDSYEFLNQMPETLTIISRKRSGRHGFCWAKAGEKKVNIPSDYGEIRASDQYVVAAGSFVPTLESDINKENMPEEVRKQIKKDINLGVYTVENEISPCYISYNEMPSFFQEQKKKNTDNEKRVETLKEQEVSIGTKGMDSSTSKLFKLTIDNVASVSKARDAHPLHNSETGANFSISNELAHCWRHSVSLTPIQYLCVKSGYMSCQDAGTPHKEGHSKIIGDNGAIFYAWKQAKIEGIIPEDDPIPTRALLYIAQQKGYIKDDFKGWKLPPIAYNRALETIREEFKINPGRIPFSIGTTPTDVSNAIYLDLLNKKRGCATEKISDYIKDNYYIYSTRDDLNSEIWVYKEGIYIPNGKSHIKEICREILSSGYTESLANAVIAKIEVDNYIDTDIFFCTNHIDEIALQNGILNLHTWELRDFDPYDVFFNKIPVAFSPNAKCPCILQHLETVLKNKDDMPVIMELFGYLLLKEYRIEKAFMFAGNGRNGKSKTVELMKRFIGADNCVSIPLQQLDSDPYALGELFNKMANLASDLNSTALKSTGNFKALTGRDIISAQRKFLTRVKFVNYAKMVFCANELPRSNDVQPAFWDRWVLLEFPYKFISQEDYDKLTTEEKECHRVIDTKIIDKLTTEEELSGLLNESLFGLKRLIDKQNFSNSKSTKEIRDMWIKKSDSFHAFAIEFLISDYESKIEKLELRRRYLIYCNEHKLKIQGDRHIRYILDTIYGAFETYNRGDENNRVKYWIGVKFNA